MSKAFGREIYEPSRTAAETELRADEEIMFEWKGDYETGSPTHFTVVGPEDFMDRDTRLNYRRQRRRDKLKRRGIDHAEE